jgi:hypothetical protein
MADLGVVGLVNESKLATVVNVNGVEEPTIVNSRCDDAYLSTEAPSWPLADPVAMLFMFLVL